MPSAAHRPSCPGPGRSSWNWMARVMFWSCYGTGEDASAHVSGAVTWPTAVRCRPALDRLLSSERPVGTYYSVSLFLLPT